MAYSILFPWWVLGYFNIRLVWWRSVRFCNELGWRGHSDLVVVG